MKISKPSFRKPNISPLFIIIVLIVAGLGAFSFNEYRKNQILLADPGAATKAQLKNLLERVGRHVELPEGEEPTVYTVTEPEKLKKQPFFARAKEGDKVLIYNKAKKAFLYRPSTDKVIEIGPVNLPSPTPSVATPSASPQ